MMPPDMDFMPEWLGHVPPSTAFSPNTVGVQINSALYIVLVFVAGLCAGNRAAEIGAIAAAGLTYLTYNFAMGDGWMRPVAMALNLCAICVGVFAGLTLLVS